MRFVTSAIACALDNTPKMVYQTRQYEILTGTRGGGANIPVDVSTWVNVRTLYFFSLRAFSMSVKCTVPPIGALICVTVAP